MTLRKLWASPKAMLKFLGITDLSVTTYSRWTRTPTTQKITPEEKLQDWAQEYHRENNRRYWAHKQQSVTQFRIECLRAIGIKCKGLADGLQQLRKDNRYESVYKFAKVG